MQMQKPVYNALPIRKLYFESFEMKFLKFCTTNVSVLRMITRNSFIFKPKDKNL